MEQMTDYVTNLVKEMTLKSDATVQANLRLAIARAEMESTRVHMEAKRAAKMYEKQKNTRAAPVFYQEMLREQDNYAALQTQIARMKASLSDMIRIETEARGTKAMADTADFYARHNIAMQPDKIAIDARVMHNEKNTLRNTLGAASRAMADPVPASTQAAVGDMLRYETEAMFSTAAAYVPTQQPPARAAAVPEGPPAATAPGSSVFAPNGSAMQWMLANKRPQPPPPLSIPAPRLFAQQQPIHQSAGGEAGDDGPDEDEDEDDEDDEEEDDDGEDEHEDGTANLLNIPAHPRGEILSNPEAQPNRPVPQQQ
jgi:hypothetical protein